MEELIAKRYVKALKESMSKEELQEALEVFKAIAATFEDQKVKEVLLSPEVKEEKKAQLLIDALKLQNKKLINLLKLLALKRRIGLIPQLAKELERELALMEKRFSGCVYSDFELSKEELALIQEALSKRTGATIELEQCGKEYDGIKVEVDTIGIEIDFSRSRIKKQLIENILKAI
jgi:F-type H+-transporting ATPase subunit delta